MRLNNRALDRVFRRRGLAQVKTLEQKVKDLFKDGSQSVWYDPSDFNSSWRRNLLTYSEQFDNAAWTKANATVTANATTAPDSASTADKLVEDTATSTHYLSGSTAMTVGVNYTASVYAKAGERTQLYINEAGVNGALFNLSTGVVVSAANCIATITAIGNGWYICAWSKVAAYTNLRFGIGNGGNASYQGDGTSGIYIWGAQLEIGTTASAYQKITDGVADYYVYGSPLPVLYQDAAGTTPVTAVEQAVGLMLDKSRGLVLGPELVTNGNFSSSAGWTLDASAGLSISGGQAIFASTPAYKAFRQLNKLTVGKFYQVEISVAEVTQGAIYLPYFSNSSISAPGFYKYIYAASGVDILLMSSNLGASAKVNSISVRELPGYHAYHTPGDTTTRPVLSRRINLLTATEDFSAWTQSNVTVTSNSTVAPNGTQTAAKFAVKSGQSGAPVAQTLTKTASALQYTASVYAKAGEWNSVALYAIGGGLFANRATVIFNLATGVISTTAGAAGTFTGASATIAPVVDGWYRITLTFTTGTETSLGVQVYPAQNGAFPAGDGTSGIYIWGASLVPADLSSLPYQRVNTATDYDSDASKFPTFLRTDGVNDSLQTNAIDFTGTDKMFVGAGVRKLSDAAVGVVAEFSASIDSNNNSFALFAPASVASNVQFASKGTATQSSTVSSITAPITNVLAGQADIALPSVSLRVNGVAATPNISSQGTGNYGNYPLYLFRRGGSSLPFNGWFYSGIIIGRTLTAAQIALVERYVASKTKTVVLA